MKRAGDPGGRDYSRRFSKDDDGTSLETWRQSVQQVLCRTQDLSTVAVASGDAPLRDEVACAILILSGIDPPMMTSGYWDRGWNVRPSLAERVARGLWRKLVGRRAYTPPDFLVITYLN